ncbi:Nuclear-pore anchor [Morella rubra]|uniref:Nuclear-pore anchor n=1 Tax=Morella rubra TaxID=262757 RepID=A0A6A1UZE7_9ROSI|nr:Nuclear-pore anchor [Morella rubra]
MPLFLTEEEFARCANDAVAVAEKADAFITELNKEVETLRAQADASAITAEQTCSFLEQKYLSLSTEFSKLESQNSQLQSSLDQHLSDLAQVQAQKHQLHLQTIGKDGEIERLTAEVSELHKSKRQLIELVEQKDLEISEKNAATKSYLDKITCPSCRRREARLSGIEAELSRAQAACSRLSQEKELIERHNVWLNDELTAKVDTHIKLRRQYNDLEADMSAKHADVERQFNESSGSLQWNKERVRELEAKLTSLQEELHSSKDAAAANEEQLSAELSTISKLSNKKYWFFALANRNKNAALHVDYGRLWWISHVVSRETKNSTIFSFMGKDDQFKVHVALGSPGISDEVNRLVELYKESSEEWSRKAGELEGVIKALETHLDQVEKDHNERLEKEVSARSQFEKRCSNKAGRYVAIAEFGGGRRKGVVMIPEGKGGQVGRIWPLCFRRWCLTLVSSKVEEGAILAPEFE